MVVLSDRATVASRGQLPSRGLRSWSECVQTGRLPGCGVREHGPVAPCSSWATQVQRAASHLPSPSRPQVRFRGRSGPHLLPRTPVLSGPVIQNLEESKWGQASTPTLHLRLGVPAAGRRGRGPGSSWVVVWPLFCQHWV